MATTLISVSAISICASASTLMVDDDGPNDPGPNDNTISDPLEDGSINHPFDRIGEAIDAAAPDDEVVVAPGDYFEAIDFGGKTLTLRSELGASMTTIDAGGQGASAISGAGAGSAIEGFTIQHGTGSQFNGHEVGGGMFNTADIVIRGCAFQMNTACDDTSNDRYGGGAIYNYDCAPTIEHCMFIENEADSGGAILNYLGSPTIRDCEFVNNSSGAGGAIHNFGEGTTTTPIIERCSLSSNESASYGGAIANDESSPMMIECRFIDNRSDAAGGAIASYRGSSPVIMHAEFCSNVAGFGGGAVVNGAGPASTTTLQDCVFKWNRTVKANGGGAVLTAWNTMTVISGSTFCSSEPDDLQGPWADQGGNVMAMSCVYLCHPDIVTDGQVDVFDLLALLGRWGTSCPPPGCVGDLDCDGEITVFDLLALLDAWGACPE